MVRYSWFHPLEVAQVVAALRSVLGQLVRKLFELGMLGDRFEEQTL